MPPERAVRDVLPGHPLARHIDDFVSDLANANKPQNTIRAYRCDLIGFAAHHDGDIARLTAVPVRAFLGEIAGQAPSTRKRKRAAVASFCKWAVLHELLAASRMNRIDTIEGPRKDVPLSVLRDRVLFETADVCGARASETCAMYVEDLDLRPHDEHARLHGKSGTVRTVLLDNQGYGPCSSSTSPGPGTPRALCSAPASRAAAARCPATRRTTGGRNTAPPPTPGSTSTSYVTRMLPS